MADIRTTKKTIMATLPIEIINEEVLPNVPVKSLVRCKCVSKYFNTLISSPEFIDLQLRRSQISDANRLLIFTRNDDSNLYSIDVESPDTSTLDRIPLPETLKETGTLFVVGSINGLLCVGPNTDEINTGEFKHALINPYTREYRSIPSRNTYYPGAKIRVSFGFGFDDINNDYKFVSISENAFNYCDYAGDNLIDRAVMIYSLKRNDWRLVEYIVEPLIGLNYQPQSGVLVKNYLLHWLFCSAGTYRIRCLDIRSENWVDDVPLVKLFTWPYADFDEKYFDKVVTIQQLGLIDGCLCLLTRTDLSKVVWIMKEYGVVESWVQLFKIPSQATGPDDLFYTFDGPFGFRHGSSKQEVFVRGGTEVFWCDIGSGNFDKAKIQGVSSFSDGWFFKGSLVPIPGGLQIKPHDQQSASRARVMMQDQDMDSAQNFLSGVL